MGAGTDTLVSTSPNTHIVYIYLFKYIIIYVNQFKKYNSYYYIFLRKIFIYNIMQIQCEYVNRDMNFDMRLVIVLFKIFTTEY
jgi:cellulose synthase/poly-beta-1,6-N-acetylglucosamine synthase-like glycosyltransferase